MDVYVTPVVTEWMTLFTHFPPSEIYNLVLFVPCQDTVKTTPNLNIDSNFFRFKSFVYLFAFSRLRVSH